LPQATAQRRYRRDETGVLVEYLQYRPASWVMVGCWNGVADAAVSHFTTEASGYPHPGSASGPQVVDIIGFNIALHLLVR
jgi:hypothetical protein